MVVLDYYEKYILQEIFNESLVINLHAFDKELIYFKYSCEFFCEIRETC